MARNSCNHDRVAERAKKKIVRPDAAASRKVPKAISDEFATVTRYVSDRVGEFQATSRDSESAQQSRQVSLSEYEQRNRL